MWRKEGFVGVFDSGVGGVSVLQHLVRELPGEDFSYFGDSAHAPYGERTLEDVQRLSRSIVDAMVAKGAKAIVIACNTATSAYAEIVRAAHPGLPIVGMEPALKPAHFARHGGKVLALATEATLRLEKFERLMGLYGDDVITVVGHGLVELVESGMAHSPEARTRLETLLAPYRQTQIDAIVLGCTHYPFLRESIQALFPQAGIFDGLYGTAMRLKSLLDQNGLRSGDISGSVEYQSSAGGGAVALMKRLMSELG